MGAKVSNYHWEGTIDVIPTGKGRPRGLPSGRFLTPKKTRAAEEEIQYLLRQLRPPRLQGPLSMRICCHFKKPKSAPVSRKYPTVKPDIDNIVKLILDAGNGILYDDDKQIVKLSVGKIYGPCESIWLELDVIQ